MVPAGSKGPPSLHRTVLKVCKKVAIRGGESVKMRKHIPSNRC